MSEKGIPKFFELLTAEDQQRYKELQEMFSSKQCRNNRNQRLSVFSEILKTVREFCEKGDANDSVRCMVCGYCTLPGGMAVNIRQLRVLVDKCKSSINGSLQRMGAVITPMKNEFAEMLQDKIPSLRSTFSELREWSIRQMSAATPQPSLPKWNIKLEPASMHTTMPTPAPSLSQQFVPDSCQIYEGGDDPFCLTPKFLDDDLFGMDW